MGYSPKVKPTNLKPIWDEFDDPRKWNFEHHGESNFEVNTKCTQPYMIWSWRYETSGIDYGPYASTK